MKKIKKGFICRWWDNRIVKVKVEKSDNNRFPLKLVSLEPGVDIGNDGGSMGIVDLSLVNFYKTEKEARKTELEKLHKQYRTEKKALRLQEKKVKWANKQISEFKSFGQIHSMVF